MDKYTTQFKRKTPIGLRSWGGGDIYAESFDEANMILHRDIEPFLEDKLGDEVSELKIGGKLVETVEDKEGLAEDLQSESTKHMGSLNFWFYIPQLDRMIETNMITKDTIGDMVKYFIDQQEYEICDRLNKIRKEIN